VVGTNGEVHSVGDAEHEFSIMSASKPFVFALKRIPVILKHSLHA
jgi:glutaminase